MYECSLADLPEVSQAKPVFRALHISDPTGYRLLRSGAMRGVRIGHVWRISRAEVYRYLGLTVTEPPTLDASATDPALARQ